MSAKRQAMASAAVAAIADMDLRGLRAEWERRYGAAPRHGSVDLLRRVLAWRVQADLLGGFDAVTLRLLSSDRKLLNLGAKPGMRLAREWAGRRHEVVVIESGVVYEGVTYGSLSEVARYITGMRWNGPRFFGLPVCPNVSFHYFSPRDRTDCFRPHSCRRQTGSYGLFPPFQTAPDTLVARHILTICAERGRSCYLCSSSH